MAGWDLCGGTFIENRDIFRGELRNNQKMDLENVLGTTETYKRVIGKEESCRVMVFFLIQEGHISMVNLTMVQKLV